MAKSFIFQARFIAKIALYYKENKSIIQIDFFKSKNWSKFVILASSTPDKKNLKCHFRIIGFVRFSQGVELELFTTKKPFSRFSLKKYETF